jgi:hypothetical protein
MEMNGKRNIKADPAKLPSTTRLKRPAITALYITPYHSQNRCQLGRFAEVRSFLPVPSGKSFFSPLFNGAEKLIGK